MHMKILPETWKVNKFGQEFVSLSIAALAVGAYCQKNDAHIPSQA